jgi:hypothetical protein
MAKKKRTSRNPKKRRTYTVTGNILVAFIVTDVEAMSPAEARDLVEEMDPVELSASAGGRASYGIDIQDVEEG